MNALCLGQECRCECMQVEGWVRTVETRRHGFILFVHFHQMTDDAKFHLLSSTETPVIYGPYVNKVH